MSLKESISQKVKHSIYRSSVSVYTVTEVEECDYMLKIKFAH